MKRGLLICLAITVFILQVSFIPALRPLGVVPNAGIALVALAGIYGTASLSLSLAIAGGFMLDLASASDFGLYTGLFVLIGLAGGYIYRAGLDSAGLLTGLILIIVATVAHAAVLLGGLSRVAVSWPLGHLAGVLALELLLNMLIYLALHPVVRWLLGQDPSQVIEVGN